MLRLGVDSTSSRQMVWLRLLWSLKAVLATCSHVHRAGLYVMRTTRDSSAGWRCSPNGFLPTLLSCLPKKRHMPRSANCLAGPLGALLSVLNTGGAPRAVAVQLPAFLLSCPCCCPAPAVRMPKPLNPKP